MYLGISITKIFAKLSILGYTDTLISPVQWMTSLSHTKATFLSLLLMWLNINWASELLDVVTCT